MTDIDTITAQLVKAVPCKTVVGHLWSGSEKAAIAPGLVEVLAKLGPLITRLVA